ncbi:MAG TPA: M48 family metalloprotease [Methylomirabilota bacterium]|nr:M48 family metalloprotease [Methylomirabilota bacterium]
MGARELVLGLSLWAAAGCAASQPSAKVGELTPAQRDSLSQILEPLLTAAGLWRGPADGCAAVFGVLEGDTIAVALMPHAPCRVRLVLTQGTLTHLDRATLRALLAHEIAHMQLGHPDARQARADAQKQTEQGVKSASRAASKAVSLIPGVGGLISQGIGTARKATTFAMEMRGNPYLAEEEQAADTMAVRFLNDGELDSCWALADLLEARLRDPGADPWEPWLQGHPVSAERIEALAAPCPRAASPANPGAVASAIEVPRPWTFGAAMLG